MLYLDHAATTPPRVPAPAAPFGNPSGLHGVAREAKHAVEAAREQAASLIGADPLEVVFTSGGTESDNLAVLGAALATDPPGGIVTTAIEHEAVLETARYARRLGAPLTVVPVGREGRVDPAQVAAVVDDTTAVVSVMSANNETGILQPAADVAAAVKERRPDVLVHTDAAQAFVSEEVTVAPFDLLTLSGHKFGGPQGVGLLYVRDGVRLEPVLHGGGQELGRRSGTHNVAGIVAFGAAMEAAAADRERFRSDVGEARRRFEDAIRTLPGVVITDGAARLVQHSHLRVDGASSQMLLIRLDELGLAASAGSACQSGAVDVSHVLRAMGWTDEQARSALRFTFGWTSRPEDGARAAVILSEVLS